MTVHTPSKPPLARVRRERAAGPHPRLGRGPRPGGPPVGPAGALRPDLTGAHWDFPERQPEKWPRERSVEHAFLTPVFGTAQPAARACPGAIRQVRLRQYSEGRAAHWLLLHRGGPGRRRGSSHLRSFATLRPDNPVTETGVLSEFSHHGVGSRLGDKRADLAPPAARPDHRRRTVARGRGRRLRRRPGARAAPPALTPGPDPRC